MRAYRLPAADRRAQILDAAITVFSRTSYADATTAAIAAEVGISEPTLFRHFSTKRALYLAALDRSATIMAEKWQKIVGRCESPLGALLTVGGWYFADLQRDSRHLRLRFRACGEVADPEIAARVRQQFRDLLNLVRDLFERAVAAGEIAADSDTRAHAWVFMAIGTLLDVTQIAGLRDDLPLETLPQLMALFTPRPGPNCPPGAPQKA